MMVKLRGYGSVAIAQLLSIFFLFVSAAGAIQIYKHGFQVNPAKGLEFVAMLLASLAATVGIMLKNRITYIGVCLLFSWAMFRGALDIANWLGTDCQSACGGFSKNKEIGITLFAINIYIVFSYLLSENVKRRYGVSS